MEHFSGPRGANWGLNLVLGKLCRLGKEREVTKVVLLRKKWRTNHECVPIHPRASGGADTAVMSSCQSWVQ